jgi:plasmid stabilization system protein ParE
VSFRVRFTETAQEDLERLQDFVLQQSNGNFALAERALHAISAGITVLQLSPFSCRKATASNTFLREVVISFGATGYIALFEIEDAHTVTVLAVRHQREDDFH